MNVETESVYLIGASGHAKVVADMLSMKGITVKGIFEKNELIKSLWEFPVQRQPQKGDWPSDSRYVIAVGNNKIRKYLAEALHDEIAFSAVVHPKSVIANRTSIGIGTVIMAGVIVSPDSRIGEHVILNTNCCIDHECIIENYVHISPNVALAGDVHVGEGTHIGIGACVIQGIHIGKWCTIGAGAVIIRDVPDGATVVGNPGRIVGERERRVEE